MSTTLPLFWHLSSASKIERVDASVKLVNSLEQFQAAFVPKEVSPDAETSEDEETTGADGLEVLNAQDVTYSIRRLIRGLGSPRESSRLGFAVALAELLSRINTVTCAQIIKLVVDNSQVQGSASGQEERDMLFAQLFGFTSIIRSGLLVRTVPLPSSPSFAPAASDLDSYDAVVSHLVTLGNKKSWLRESAWWTISLAIDAVHRSSVPWKERAIQNTIETLLDVNTTWSSDKVAAALQLKSLYPELDWNKRLSPTFKHGEILHGSNLTTLARILKESDDSSLDDVEKGIKTVSSSGTWKAQAHYVWDILLDHVLSGTPSGRHNTSIQDFFRIVVDESLFANTASPERKYWGFQIFQKALARSGNADIPMLFTRNFMRCWINHLSQKDRYLHQIAKRVADDVRAAAQKSPAIAFTLVLQLTGAHGSHLFDRITKTKTVESILVSMDAAGVTHFVGHLLGLVNTNDELDSKALDARRTWILDQLALLVRNGAVPKDDAWVSMVLDWLTLHGLFVVVKKSEKSAFCGLRSIPKPELSNEFRENCRMRLLGCLADLTSQNAASKDGVKETRQPGTMSNGQFWIYNVLDTIASLEKDSKHVRPIREADAQEQAIRKRARSTIEAMKVINSDHKTEALGAELLLSSILLNRYCSKEDEEENSEPHLLDACINAVYRMFPVEKPKKSKKVHKPIVEVLDVVDSDEPPPIDILIDVLIGFLETSTAYMRAVANQVFAMLTSAVQVSTLDLIAAQLERRDPTAEDEDDTTMDDAETSEGEHVLDVGEESEEPDSDEQDEEDKSDVEENEEVDPEFRLKLEQALGGLEPSGAALDQESEEELMDDEQMLAIDEQLAAIFRSRKGADKKKSTSAQREATYFKNRVLDFLDIFLRTQSASPLAPRCVPPLVRVLAGAGPDERQLADKAAGIVRSRLGKAKEVPTGERVDVAMLRKALEEVHVRARKAVSGDILTSLAICSAFLVRVLLQANEKDAVLEEYRASLVDYVTRKASALNANFIADFVRRHPAEAWALCEDVLQILPEAVNSYRQVQALGVLLPLVNQVFGTEERKTDILSFIPSLRIVLLNILTSAYAEDASAAPNAGQMKDLFKFTLQAVRQTRKVLTPEQLQTAWKPEEWSTLKSRLEGSQRFGNSKALHNACGQVLQVIGANNGRKEKGLEDPNTLAKKGRAEEGSAKPFKKRKAEVEGEKVKRKKTKSS